MTGSRCSRSRSRQPWRRLGSTRPESSVLRRRSPRLRRFPSSATVRRSAGLRSSRDGRTRTRSCGNTTRRRSRPIGSRQSRQRGRSRGSPATAAGSRRNGNSRRRFRCSRKRRTSMRRATAGSRLPIGSSGSFAVPRPATPAPPGTRASSRTAAIRHRAISARCTTVSPGSSLRSSTTRWLSSVTAPGISRRRRPRGRG